VEKEWIAVIRPLFRHHTQRSMESWPSHYYMTVAKLENANAQEGTLRSANAHKPMRMLVEHGSHTQSRCPIAQGAPPGSVPSGSAEQIRSQK
jgi:hypothetical protein